MPSILTLEPAALAIRPRSTESQESASLSLRLSLGAGLSQLDPSELEQRFRPVLWSSALQAPLMPASYTFALLGQGEAECNVLLPASVGRRLDVLVVSLGERQLMERPEDIAVESLWSAYLPVIPAHVAAEAASAPDVCHWLGVLMDGSVGAGRSRGGPGLDAAAEGLLRSIVQKWCVRAAGGRGLFGPVELLNRALSRVPLQHGDRDGPHGQVAYGQRRTDAWLGQAEWRQWIHRCFDGATQGRDGGRDCRWCRTVAWGCRPCHLLPYLCRGGEPLVHPGSPRARLPWRRDRCESVDPAAGGHRGGHKTPERRCVRGLWLGRCLSSRFLGPGRGWA